MEGMEQKNVQEKIIIEYHSWEDVIYAFFGIKEKCVPERYLADQLAKLDPNENHVHVQYSDKPDVLPIVWQIREWRTEATRLNELKRGQEESQRKNNIILDAKKILMKAIAEQMGGEEKDHETFAMAIILTKNADVAKQLYGVDVSMIKDL